MCGRYSFAPDVKALAQLFDGVQLPTELEQSFNIAPTQMAYVITAQAPHLLSRMAWGLVPPYAHASKPDGRHINARAETVLTNAAFKHAVRKQRCLVPADSFYEWKKVSAKQKQAYRILPKIGGVLVFAGIWEHHQAPDGSSNSFSILTTEPNIEMAEIHNRMPIIFTTQAEQKLWLSDAEPEALSSLLQPAPNGTLQMYPISAKVGKHSINDASLHLPQAEIKTLFD
jgi:putative SOS response-associated peptidase YedK